MSAKSFDPAGFWRARLADTGAGLNDRTPNHSLLILAKE
jgi:hypothetical protein